MDRLIGRGMQVNQAEFLRDEGWLQERQSLVDGVRVWSAGPNGRMRLLLLGQPGIGLVYVGDLSR